MANLRKTEVQWQRFRVLARARVRANGAGNRTAAIKRQKGKHGK